MCRSSVGLFTGPQNPSSLPRDPQTASLANAGVYASIAMVDVEARAVHSGLCTLWAQAFKVGTCAQCHQADVLAKYANTIPLSNQSLFGVGLKTMVAKAACAARDYAAMAECFVQAGLHHPKLLHSKESCKRTYEGSPLRFMARNTSLLWTGATGPYPPRGRG